jgi:hypothetical protein
MLKMFGLLDATRPRCYAAPRRKRSSRDSKGRQNENKMEFGVDLKSKANFFSLEFGIHF